MSKVTQEKSMDSKFKTVRLRTETRERADKLRKKFVGRRAKPLNDVMAAGLDALERFPDHQQEALIDGRPLESSEPTAA
jgi:hypothetical protein